MITISTKLIAQFLDNATDFFICEIGTPNLYALPELKLFTQLIVIPWSYFKDASKRKRMSAVRELGSKCLNTGMEHAKTN